MKYVLLSFLILVACGSSSTTVQAAESNALVGKMVVVVLDNASQQAPGRLVSLNRDGVIIRLTADGKLYFYPTHRIFVVGEQ